MTTLTEKTLEDLKQNSAQGVTHAAGEAIRSKHYAEFGPFYTGMVGTLDDVLAALGA